MQTKPKTITGYESEQVELVLMTCRYISTILGDFMDEIVIVGGLVPSLIIDQSNLPEGIEPHAGTMDLDIGLSIAVYDDQLYQKITERLRGAGFSPDTNDKGNPTNQRWQINNGGGKVTIDFLIPATEEDVGKAKRFKNLEKDFAALPADGLMLAFDDYIEIALNGPTIKGETIVNRKIRVCGPGAYIVLKAIAFNNRGENKDAYDLFYTVRNYGAGPEEVAERFLALGSSEYCTRALTVIKENFLEINYVGCRRAAEFLLGDDAGEEDLQAEVAGFMKRFIDLVDQSG
jgi:predicted nucleotidyltransferase